jgi:hypothetical protein
MVPLCVVAVSIALTATGCSGDRSGGPRGEPSAIVGHAPALTFAARTARVVIDGSDANATGVVYLTSGVSRLDVSDGSTVVLAGDTTYRRAKGETAFRRVTADAVPASLRPGDPVAAVALVAGMTTVRSDGGAEVRGASTIAYTIKVDAKAAISAAPPDRQGAIRRVVGDPPDDAAFQLEVAVDSQGRVRRVLLPVPLRPGPPTTRVDAEPVAVTVDLFDFGAPPAVTVPTPAELAP